MREYGLHIKDTSSKPREFTVYFVPLSYFDWITYHDTATRYEDTVYRYLITQYVVRLDSTEDMAVVDLIHERAAVKKQIIDYMFEKAGFTDTDGYAGYIEQYKKQAGTLMGTYDYFLWRNAGPDIYLSLLDMDAGRRAHVIAMYELLTGISVKDRFTDAIANNLPVDIVSDHDKYIRDQRKMNRTKAEHQTLPPPKQQSNPQIPSGVDTNILTSMLTDSQRALAEEMSYYRQNRESKRRHFNIDEDRRAFQDFESEQ